MPNGEIFAERRRHKRGNKKLKVTYKIISNADIDKPGIEPLKKTVDSHDISIMGIQLLCDEKLSADQMLRLDIMLNDGFEPLATFAEVKWSKFDEAIKKFRTGMQFLVIKEDHIGIIRKMIGD